MITAIFGLIMISIGLKAFSADGLPLTNSKRLIGRSGKVAGTICVLIGGVWVLAGLMGTSRLIGRLLGGA